MISVFVLVDALGWQLVKDRSFLADVLPHRAELQTIFGFSSAAIPSILTGLLPREHGHWNLFVYDPANSPFRWTRFLRWFPSSWINSRICRKVVAEVSRRTSGTRGYFQIYGVPVEILPMFDVCEKDDIYSPGGLHPSSSIFDRLQQKGVPYRSYSYHQYTDQQAVRQVVRDIRAAAARFYFVYLAELDNFLHYNVHQPGPVLRELEKYEAYIREIHAAAAAMDDDVRFYVFSDHGMTPISETYDLMASVRKLGWKVPDDYLALYDSTMARFWFYGDRARNSILAHLEGLPCGRVVTPEDQRTFGIDFGHNRFGDAVFLMKEGCLMHPSHMGKSPWPGMHGFHPDAASSSACLLASGKPPVPIGRVSDMFRLMLTEAGIS